MKECGLVKYGDIALDGFFATDEEAKNYEVDQRSVTRPLSIVHRVNTGEYVPAI